MQNEFFQNSGMKNELSKVQVRKTKLMYSLGTKTIFWPKIYIKNLKLLYEFSYLIFRKKKKKNNVAKHTKITK